jgi:signal transduction histidine kinase
MAVTTALSLLVLAAARTVPVTHATRFVRPAAATAVGGVAGLACLGYLYGVRSLYEIGPFSAVAVHTAACLGALALAELAVVPDGVLTNVIRGSGPGAVLSRRLLPVAVIVLPTLAYLRLRGQQAGWYDTHFGIAILATGSVMVVTSVTLIAARGLDHADEARQKLVLELREVNDSLESQVGERSHRLVEKEAQVAVFADRDRIAADLHDRIIQRIFANGMQLESIAARVNDKALSGRIVSIVDDLDKGIAELRETIFMLKTLSTPTDLDTNVHETAHDASRVLGFNPSVAMTGELTRVPSDAGTHLLAVLRESLSNVARHADASEVDVTLIVDEHVTLIVRDNGRGLPSELAHASGTKNIQVRAETLGGTAQWTANEPQGTEFRWRIPLADPWVL